MSREVEGRRRGRKKEEGPAYLLDVASAVWRKYELPSVMECAGRRGDGAVRRWWLGGQVWGKKEGRRGWAGTRGNL